MDELPGLVAEAVGDATVVSTVDLGGGDRVVVTTTETHVYRSDGLLSDESVDTFGHDVETVAVERGRRKHTVRLAGMTGERSFTVPARSGDAVIEAVLEGVLRTTGAVEEDETITAQFRFSELTVVVTDRRLLKHVGGAVWDVDEYEDYPYDELVALDFEEGSVNTQIIVQTAQRQERLKVSNDRAVRIREELQSAVFEHHGVSSLAGLRRELEPDEEDPDGDAAREGDAEDADAGVTSGGPGRRDEAAEVERGGDRRAGRRSSDDREEEQRPERDRGAGGVGRPSYGADVLGGDGDDEPRREESSDDGFVSANWSPPADQDVTGPRGRVDRGGGKRGSGTEGDDDGSTGSPTGSGVESVPGFGTDSGDDAESRSDDVEALAEEVRALGEQMDRQAELLERQGETLERLVDELRRGR